MEESISLDKSKPGKLIKKWDVFLLLLLAISLSLNVFLGWEVKRLKNSERLPVRPVLTEGMKFPIVVVSDLNNKQETIDCTGIQSPTVFYIFSPACVWCDRNLRNIEALVKSRSSSYRFIGLSLTEKSLKEYLVINQLSLPVYKNLSRDSIRNLGLGSTPQTIIVSPEGIILKNWTGAYTGQLQGEVESYFGIQLPGITSQEEKKDDNGSQQGCAQC